MAHNLEKSDMNSVLVVVPHDAALSEYMRLFASSNAISPVFYFNYDSAFLSQIESKGWAYVCTRFEKRKSSRKIKYLIGKFLDESWAGIFLQTYIFKNCLSNKLKKSIKKSALHLEHVMQNFNVTTLLISSDRSYGVEASAILCGEKLNLPVYLLSFAYSADYKSCYKLRGAKIYSQCSDQPANVVYDDVELGKKAFYRPFEALALKEMGLLSSNPWILGAGRINSMLLDSERERNRLLKLGAADHKYTVTGLAAHDLLHEKLACVSSLRRKVCSQYSFSKVFTVAVSIPQYWEHDLCSKSYHFRVLKDMIRALSVQNLNVLVSLHPKMERSHYEWANSYDNVSLAVEDVCELIPICDVFVATYSSTVAWALMCKKHIAIIDHVGLGYSDFYDEFDIPVFDKNQELASHISQIMGQDDERVTKPFYPRELVSELSPFDGRCASRIMGVLTSVCGVSLANGE